MYQPEQMSPHNKPQRFDRVAIIQAIQTPLGFFVLVVLVVEVVFGIIAGLQSGPDRTYLVVGMILLMFFVVAVVAFLAYKGKGLALPQKQERDSITAPKFLLLVGPPEDMPDLDITMIEWDDDECFVLGNKLKELITLVPSKVGPSFRVQMPRQLVEKLEPDYPLELQLKDKKGHRWRVKRFFMFENLLPLHCIDDRKIIAREYGEGSSDDW
jgi:hypothetical protein